MKFAEHLSAHITPEWRKQYILYEEMKVLLYSAVEQAPSVETVELDVITRYFTKFDEKFFHYCDKELAKINTFYSEKLAEAIRKSANLCNDLSEAQDEQFNAKSKTLNRADKFLHKRNNVSGKKIHELKLAFSEFYLSLILLQNYQTLNYTGFKKILKKHDKLLSTDVGSRWRVDHVENSYFYMNKDIDRIIRETETMVTQELEGGDRQRAMKRLRVPPLGEQQSPWMTFKVGLFSGALIVLMIAVLLSALSNYHRIDWAIATRLYRGPFIMVQFLFMWGINIYGWRSSGVNHVLIFEMDPRNHLSEQHIIEMAGILGIVWSVSVLLYVYGLELGIPGNANALVLIVLFMVFLVNPTKTCKHEARFWALRVLTKVMLTPFFFVNFADFWMADQLNSMVVLFTDIPFYFCYFISNNDWSITKDGAECLEDNKIIRGIMASLPAWFRFAQCLRRFRDTKEANPHFINAVKYFTVFLVVSSTMFFLHYHEHYTIFSNPYFYLMVITSIINSTYAYIWDIILDWGLFDPNPGDNLFLREEIVYSSTWLYYFGIVEDLVFRFIWVLFIPISELGYVDAEILITILAPFEVFRRFIWNFFRLENEHLNNCGRFRAVRDISVAPIDCSDQLIILRMMDEEDGATNRKLKKRHVYNSKNHHQHHHTKHKFTIGTVSIDDVDL